MSNFPIIRTTPPPLDTNESEEEEPDFGSFNGVSGDEEEDIDFVVPVVQQNSGKQTVIDNNNTSDDPATVDDNECNETEMRNEDIVCDNSITIESNTCDDNSIKSTEHDISYLNNEDDINNIGDDVKELELESLPDTEPIETNVDKELEDIEDNKDVFTDELNNIESGVHEEDDDFADFSSFRFTKCEDNGNQFDDSSDQSLSFYNSKNLSEISVTDCVPNVDNNSNAIKSSEVIANTEVLDDNESDDDFADFASAQPVFNTHLQSVPDLKANSSSSTQFEDNDSEFADFSSFQTNNTINGFIAPVENEMVSQSVPDSDQLTQLFAQLFPLEETISCDENSQYISRDLFNRCDQNSKNLWKQLQDLESAPSLKLRWPNSHSFQLLLTALNIDPRNILRNSSVPVFASGLGCVLEPTKHLYNTPIPPVQFDWGSSGLTNPLDVNQKSAVAFDLDFFVTNDDVKNTKRQNNFSDLDDFLNDKNGNICDNESKDLNKTNIMQQILSSVSSTSSATNANTGSSQVLSAEALQVLDELPYLSFMRAKVLVFKSQTNS
ncbi:unnamed protein product [Oppiella nova]|uniref:Aftiphilin clathrin-binding box domain-containing protein n=1 Tax=Oppiella nova TaxID=334625 RepID=A0A7R9L9L2_9ACAR|nr:unnamed protein product [Oppiella nova]CAG2160544.1 unnamed protein product [Oppiella nova]